MDHAVQSIVDLARDSSPYYQELYRDIPAGTPLEKLPLLEHTSYWAASSNDQRLVMTSSQVDGVVMKTGGTTSRPKTTAYSQADLQRTASLLASGLLAGGVRAGDRIANMFYAGNLYASFLLHVLSVMALPVPAVHVPIGGLTEIPEAVDLVENTNSTVLLTTATSLVKMANHVTAQGRTIDRIRCVLFGGEPLFPEQETAIRQAFPRASIKSCIYGSVDAGVLAKAAPGDDSRLHQAFDDTVVLEIIRNDGSGTVVDNNDEIGMLVATNTLRQLTPVIRYSTGDRAVWVDKGKGLFRLLGRAGQAVRLGPVSVDVTDLRTIVTSCCKDTGIVFQGFQAVIARSDGADQLECVIATPTKPHNMTEMEVQKATADAVAAELYLQRPMFKQHVDRGLIAPLLVKFVGLDSLRLANGSHKVLDVVETRFAEPIAVPTSPDQNGEIARRIDRENTDRKLLAAEVLESALSIPATIEKEQEITQQDIVI